MPDPPFDKQQAQRWFAIEFNNRAWDLIEAPQRSEAESEELLHSAHAACLHWLSVGEPINHLRGQVLVTTAYVTLERPDCAVAHAEKILDLTKTVDGQTPFDVASVHGAAGAAFRLAGQTAAATEQSSLLQSAFQRIDDPEERRIIWQSCWGSPPAPRGSESDSSG